MKFRDPIIDELHDIREEIVNEAKSQGIPLHEYLGKDLPSGFKSANIKPTEFDLSKLKVEA